MSVQPRSMLPTALSALFAVSGTAVLFLSTIANPLVTRRSAVLLAVAGGLFFCAYQVSQARLLKAGPALSRRASGLLWGASLLLSIPLSLLWPGSLSYLQVRTLEVRVVDPAQAASSAGLAPAEPLPLGKVVFIGLDSGDVTVPHSMLRTEGDWTYQDARFSAAGDQPASLHWSGRTSSRPRLLFLAGPEMGSVSIRWDGQEELFRLQAPQETEVSFSPAVQVSWGARLLYSVSCALFLTLLFALAGRYVLGLRAQLPPAGAARPFFWLKFSLPAAALPLFFSLAFSPGLMSGDSLVQWTQVQTLQFNDHHPVFSTLFLWLCSRLWNSPSAVALVQVLGLALVVGWGLGLLVRRGLPQSAAWAAAALMGCSPVNWLYLNTIWKDVPYAICVLWLTLLAFEVCLSDGKWLARRSHWAALVVCAVCVSLFRHNGAAVSFLFLALLLVVYRPHWKWTTAALAAVVLLRGLVTGPLYQALQVKPMEPALQYATVLYHLGAHIQAGTPRTDAETRALAALLPIEKWDYTKCTAEPIISLKEINMQPFSENPGGYLQMAVNLFLRSPWVDVRTVWESGELVYRLIPDCRLYITPLYYKPARPMGASWMDYYSSGMRETPVLPNAWVRSIARVYDQTFSLDSWAALYVLLWCPAVALYALIVNLLLVGLLLKKWQIVVVGAPALIQSVVLMLVILAEQTRYQYSVYLAAGFSLAFVLYAVARRGETRTG